MSAFEELFEKINNQQAVLGVVGLGYVGLPLALAKAQSGYRVVGFDLDAQKVAAINAGQSYIEDVASEELKEQVDSGHLRATADFSEMAAIDAVSVCVPTPIDEYKQPELDYLIQAVSDIADRMAKPLLIILNSTTYPGTTEDVVKPLLEERGKTVGKDVFLAYSPERIDPGNKNFQIKKIPRVVGGVTPYCSRLASALYVGVMQNRLVEVDSPKIAEMAKIVENTFRLVNIGLINELAILCHRMGLDIWKVIEAASTKPYGFLPFYPGPGIGGHCIPVDPYYLVWKAKKYHSSTQLIQTAGEVNESMPGYVVYRMMSILNDFKMPMKGNRILLLGVAYKKNVNDVRESPVLEIIKMLEHSGANWTYHDPCVGKIHLFDRSIASVPLTEDIIRQQDLVVITTDHDQVDYPMIAEQAKIIFDTRNVMSGRACKGAYYKL